MYGESFSGNLNGQTKHKEKMSKKKKRKFNFLIEEPSMSSISVSPKIKKKRKLLKAENFENSIPKAFHFENGINYATVIADPKSLHAVPKIFKKNGYKSKTIDLCNSFLMDFLSEKSFNQDVSDRFSQLEISKKNKEKKKKLKDEKKVKKKERLRISEESTSPEHSKKVIEEYEPIENHVNTFKSTKKGALIFHMPHPSKFSFHGEIQITLITGEIEVLGYVLSHSSKDKSINIYSPNLCTPLIIESKLPKQNFEIQETNLKEFLSQTDYESLLAQFKPDDSIILIQQIISSFGIVLNKYFNTPLFPKDLEDVSSMTETSKSLQSIFTFQLSKQGKHFRKSPQWDKIPLGHSTVLCGGKGVGKSMLLKYYINKLVSVGERVLCLDLDPGQPEFTTPGCVSAVIIDQPLIGPNFTHVIDPMIMTYFGDVDVSKNPTKYMENVKYVIECCRKNEKLVAMKWFVNTMGFCKGLGVDLMITILKLLKPNTVIQIKSSDMKNNYPFYLTPVSLNSAKGFEFMPDVSLWYDLRVIMSSAENDKKQLLGGLKRKQHRDIMSLSYFSKMVSPPFYNFNAVQPYLISFSKLYLGIDFLINPKDVLKAFNGNMVSLSHFRPGSEETFIVKCEEDVCFQIVIKPSVASCFGIGIVRGIDIKEKKFYLLTHLPVEVLDKVNCLSLGRISPPHSMFLKQEGLDKPSVYTTTGRIEVIHGVKRMFRVHGTPQAKDKIQCYDS